MNKISLLFTCCVLILIACVDQQRGYVISGTAEGTVDGDTIYLCDMEGFFSFSPVDTAIVKDGKFEFRGVADETLIRYILPTHNGSNEGLGFADVPFENGRLDVQIFKSESGKAPIIVNHGPEAPVWDKYHQLEKEWNDREEEFWSVVRDGKGSEEEIVTAQVKLDSVTAKRVEALRQFIIDNANTGVGDYLFGQYYNNPANESARTEFLKAYQKKNPDGSHYRRIMKMIEGKRRNEVGAQFIDFSMADPSGKMIRLSDIVKENKYTLVDFWASWCGPCRAEMPNVVSAYTKFHDNGLEVLGVSLDESRDAWLKAVDKLHMPWPQVSDLKGWKCEGAALYGVQAIPANVLIDQSGKIVAKNLRAEELHVKLESLLK